MTSFPVTEGHPDTIDIFIWTKRQENNGSPRVMSWVGGLYIDGVAALLFTMIPPGYGEVLSL
jgi:hypothetical protein